MLRVEHLYGLFSPFPRSHCLVLSRAAVSIRTLVGQGGAGKTRFAYELYRHFRTQPDWGAYFLHFLKNEAKEVDLWKEITCQNAFLIADYASDNPRALTDLLRPLTGPAPAGRRLRVLLLARTADWDQGWLFNLRSGRTGEDLERCFHPRDPEELPAITPVERRKIFEQTATQAAQFTGKPVPLLPSLEVFSKNEVEERLADPLTSMMAAVTALHLGSAAALSLDRSELAFDVSQKLVADRIKGAVQRHQELFLHMAAYATLCGGLEKEQALRVLDEESAETHLGRVDDPAAFLDRLQAWLPGERAPGEETWLGAIQPDIVGEAYLLGKGPHAKGRNSYLRDPEATVLRAVRHRPTQTINTVVRTAQDFSFTRADSRQEPLLWLERLVKRGEADADCSVPVQLEMENAFSQ